MIEKMTSLTGRMYIFDMRSKVDENSTNRLLIAPVENIFTDAYNLINLTSDTSSLNQDTLNAMFIYYTSLYKYIMQDELESNYTEEIINIVILENVIFQSYFYVGYYSSSKPVYSDNSDFFFNRVSPFFKNIYKMFKKHSYAEKCCVNFRVKTSSTILKIVLSCPKPFAEITFLQIIF
jgi:hypothetical protein